MPHRHATLRDFHARNLLLDAGSPAEFRLKLLNCFERTWGLFERLFDTFAGDDTFYVQPEPLRHPHIFYFGHTATFYINKLNLAKLIDFRINPAFESLFAIGVDEMSWDDLDSSQHHWPAVEEVRAYRQKAREVVKEVIRTAPLAPPLGWEDPLWAVLMGIEHERIHLETSSVLIRQTALRHLKHDSFWSVCPISGEPPANHLLPVPGDQVLLGKARDHNQFGWDNEYGHHVADVDPFRASRYLVSNGEFLEFMEAGGYGEPRWWSPEGQAWLAFKKPEHPVFWVKHASRQGDVEWRYRTLLTEIPLPWDWPVDVNWLEAKAFCNWKAAATGKSIRLPTEDEWACLLNHSGIPDEPYWGEYGQAPGNINLEHWASSCPVGQFEFRDGFCDVVGNVWQWTETPMDAFPGFQVHPWYDDFSTPTFDNRHNLIKGGSWISTGNEANRHSRYAFRRHFFQHAGFRYVEAGPTGPRTGSPHQPRGAASPSHTAEARLHGGQLPAQGGVYETDALLAQYCEFHYGGEYLGVANYPKACADLCLEAMGDRPKGRALDLGCATGRTSFELARAFDHVDGVDFTARFVRLALSLKEAGQVSYALPTEGGLTEQRTVRLQDLGLAPHGLADLAGKVGFHQGDACNLKPRFTGYDLIFAGNLIDRLYSPRRFLEDVHERLNPGGLLVLTSPYTWLEEFTAREEWLGGHLRHGQPVTTLRGLHEVLDTHFRLVGAPRQIPFVIRETARKFQHTLAEMTVWEKRGP